MQLNDYLYEKIILSLEKIVSEKYTRDECRLIAQGLLEQLRAKNTNG